MANVPDTLLAAVQALEDGDTPDSWLLDDEPKKLNDYFKGTYVNVMVCVNTYHGNYTLSPATKFLYHFNDVNYIILCRMVETRAERYYRFSDISRYCASIDIAIFCS